MYNLPSIIATRACVELRMSNCNANTACIIHSNIDVDLESEAVDKAHEAVYIYAHRINAGSSSKCESFRREQKAGTGEGTWNAVSTEYGGLLWRM